MRHHLTVLAFTVACLLPRLVEACPVCFSGTGENREAYFATFVFLTITPLLGAGLLIWWLLRRVRMLEAEANVPATTPEPALTPAAATSG